MITFFAAGAGVGLELVRRGVPRGSLARLIVDRVRVAEDDLAVTNLTAFAVATQRLMFAMAMAAVPMVALMTTAMLGSPLPSVPMLLWSIVGAAVGFQLPAIQLRQRAKVARDDFRTSLSAYLDLVSTMLAGGAGIETALVAAVRVGDGAAFDAIAVALDRAHSQRVSPWDALAAEGSRIGVDELPELAATIKLGGEQGARMTASLIAKANSMRSKQMSDIEARANSATERMGLPMVMLFLGFLVLLGYPAMHMIGAGFSG